MFSQIKLYIAGAVAFAFSALGLYAKYQSSQKEKYKAESEVNKEKSDSADKRIEAHEKREEVENNNASVDVDAIDNGLHKYYRD